MVRHLFGGVEELRSVVVRHLFGEVEEFNGPSLVWWGREV